MPPPPRPIIRPELVRWAVGCILVAGTVLLYLPSAGFGFINYDDPQYITNNPAIQSGFHRDSIVWAFTAPTVNWHPLTWFSHMLDWSLYGESAAGHHLTSIGWHALNALLVFLLLRRLTGAFWTAAFAAALFAWHPLRVESVTWLAERKDVLSGFFFLLSLHAYATYADRRTRSGLSLPWYLLTFALFILGLMSKPMVITLPVILLVLDFWPLRRLPELGPAGWPALRPLMVEKIPFLLVSLASAVVTLFFQRTGGSFTLDLPLGARMLNAFVATARYLGKFFWPEGLSAAYPHPVYWPALVAALAIALVVALSWVAWRQRQKQPWLLAGWAWFLLMLLPVIGLIQVGFQSMADRYTYLPILGVEIALLWSLREIIQRHSARILAAVSAGIVLLACAFLTWRQQAVWRDSVPLFSHALAVTENNAMAEGFLAYSYLGRDEIAAAAEHADRALAISPDNDPALRTLAEVRRRQGNFPAATALYRQILTRHPQDPLGEFNLGRCLLELQQTDEAKQHLQAAAARDSELLQTNLKLATAELRHGHPLRAIVHYQVAVALDPDNADLRFGLGTACLQASRRDEAAAAFEQTLQLRPDHAAAHTETGLLLLETRDPTLAAEHFRRALAAQPRLGLAWVGLGRAAESLGYPAEADTCFTQAAACAPDTPAVFTSWAEVLARRGRFAEAIAPYQRALQLQPGDAGAHAGLGFVLYLTQQREAAMQHWEEALRLNPNIPGLRERLAQARRSSGQ